MALCGSCHCPRVIVTTLCAWCADHHSHSQQGWVLLCPSHPGVPTVPHVTRGQRQLLTKETPSAYAMAGYVSGCVEDLAGVCPVTYREEGHWACWVGETPTAPNTGASNLRCRGAMISSKRSNLVMNQAPWLLKTSRVTSLSNSSLSCTPLRHGLGLGILGHAHHHVLMIPSQAKKHAGRKRLFCVLPLTLASRKISKNMGAPSECTM